MGLLIGHLGRGRQGGLVIAAEGRIPQGKDIAQASDLQVAAAGQAAAAIPFGGRADRRQVGCHACGPDHRIGWQPFPLDRPGRAGWGRDRCGSGGSWAGSTPHQLQAGAIDALHPGARAQVDIAAQQGATGLVPVEGAAVGQELGPLFDQLQDRAALQQVGQFADQLDAARACPDHHQPLQGALALLELLE